MTQTNELKAADVIAEMRAWTTLEPRQGSGILYVRGRVRREAALVRCLVERDGNTISEERFRVADFEEGVSLRDLQVRYWWPHDAGEQPMYGLRVELLDASGAAIGSVGRPVGFKHVVWEPDCVINDRPIALRRVDWTGEETLEACRDRGVNTLRLTLAERDAFYDRCDALGLMVWQEFPAGEEARAIVERLAHHACLLVWASPDPARNPELEALVSTLDPTRRFVPA